MALDGFGLEAGVLHYFEHLVFIKHTKLVAISEMPDRLAAFGNEKMEINN